MVLLPEETMSLGKLSSFCSSVVLPCLVANDPVTKNPIKLHFIDQPKAFRHINPQEAEAIQGWPNDITNGRHVPLNL